MLVLNVKKIIEKGKEIILQEVKVSGWVKSFRSNKFIALNDGSSFSNIQLVLADESINKTVLDKINVGASIEVVGTLVESEGAQQDFEIKVKEIKVLGEANPQELQETILQPKRHSLEKLRSQAHLRFRTNTFSAIMRVRNAVSFAIHLFFQEKGFYYVHTPIITGADAEGAGEMFHVTAFDLDRIPRNENNEIDYKQDFFGKATNLTVSGQLEGETAAMGLGKIYTFGPTFRAENSNTTRHLAEFWMVEPEMAFYNLDMTMDLAEEFIKYVIQYTLDKCPDELDFLDKRFAEEQSQKPKEERSEMGLIERLKYITNSKFQRVSYTEAIDILKESKPNKKGKFTYPIDAWGADLQSEHERFLVEKYYQKPVILYDYPADIKAFYMRLNEDGKTVRAMDVLFPGIGEIIGGSQREERVEVLSEKMDKMNIDKEELWWYLDIRKYGTVPHSGFGLGLERLVLFISGMGNIRDVIPYPRTPKNANF